MSPDNKLNKQQLKNKPHKSRKPFNFKQFLIIFVFSIYFLLSVYGAIKDSEEITGNVTMNQVEDMISQGEIEQIIVHKSSQTMSIYTTDGQIYTALNPQNDTFIYDLSTKGVNLKVQEKTMLDSVMSIGLTLPLMLIMAMLISYLSNTIVGGNTKMFTLIKNENNHTTFDDIRGMGKTKDDIQFIVNQMKNWKQLGELGARPCKGALLYGPPGTGKTLLAKAIAKESGVGFISCSGSDFNEVFVGVGAGRIRSLFELASVNAPCIIFIDEIDCLGKRRKGGDGGANEHNQTLNALLQKMDGLNKANGIMVIGATNRKDDLDSALTRPGRFDKHYFVGAPDNKKDRDELVEIYLSNKKLDLGKDKPLGETKEEALEKVSKLMVGLTGAQVEEALNSAVYISLQDNRDGIIKLSDIDEAVMQTLLGGIKREHSSKEDEKITAIHEAGHTIVSLVLGQPIAKTSIIPYSSGTGGATLKDTDKTGEQKLRFKSDFEKEIKILLAGKCAEDFIYGEHTQGCSGDLEKATELIYNMMTQFGMIEMHREETVGENGETIVYSQENLINDNVLIEHGVIKSARASVIDKCNKLLTQYENEVADIIDAKATELYNFSERLLEEKTVVNPTLDTISQSLSL